MRPPLLLYSVQTWLAYAIAERFYQGTHYAWCSPCYDGVTADRHVNIPPTSSPAEIYRNLLKETRRGERHSAAIKKNQEGVLTGAAAKWSAGEISQAALEEIRVTVATSHPQDYRPVLFVIPFQRVTKLAREVPVEDRAHPLSIEYKVERLPRGCFDMIEFRS